MRPRRPVRRHRVAVAFAIGVLSIVVIVLIGEALRHPGPADIAARGEDEAGGDPRVPVECPPPDLPPPGRLVGEILEVTSNQLYDCPVVYDGRRVRYRGEAVGHVLRRREGAWVQLNDDVYAQDLGPLPVHRDFRGGNAGVGVFVPHDLAEQITTLGGPNDRGDIVEVVGTFQRVDSRGEIAVIQALEGRVVDRGEPFHDPVLRDRQIAALVALAIAIAIVWSARRAARRR
jgi:hypothetical protein